MHLSEYQQSGLPQDARAFFDNQNNDALSLSTPPIVGTPDHSALTQNGGPLLLTEIATSSGEQIINKASVEEHPDAMTVPE